MKNEQIIKVDGKFYIKSKVVMLPTEKASKLFIHKGGELCFNVSGEREKTEFVLPQHLYFLSDEDIKEGDWAYTKWGIDKCSKVGPAGIRYFDKLSMCWNTHEFESNQVKKIIASTEELLFPIEAQSLNGFACLPRPSNEFLQAYCRADGKIDEVLVEINNVVVSESTDNYDDNDLWVNGAKYFSWSHAEPEIMEKEANKYRGLKVSPDNTITIRPFESQKMKNSTKQPAHTKEEFFMSLDGIQEVDGYYQQVIHGINGDFNFCFANGVNKEQCEANAQRIVKAVNMHDELVSALKKMVDERGFRQEPRNSFVLSFEEKVLELLKQAEQK